jgi:hypothetical protein
MSIGDIRIIIVHLKAIPIKITQPQINDPTGTSSVKLFIAIRDHSDMMNSIQSIIRRIVNIKEKMIGAQGISGFMKLISNSKRTLTTGIIKLKGKNSCDLDKEEIIHIKNKNN